MFNVHLSDVSILVDDGVRDEDVGTTSPILGLHPEIGVDGIDVAISLQRWTRFRHDWICGIQGRVMRVRVRDGRVEPAWRGYSMRRGGRDFSRGSQRGGQISEPERDDHRLR